MNLLMLLSSKDMCFLANNEYACNVQLEGWTHIHRIGLVSSNDPPSEEVKTLWIHSLFLIDQLKHSCMFVLTILFRNEGQQLKKKSRIHFKNQRSKSSSPSSTLEPVNVAIAFSYFCCWTWCQHLLQLMVLASIVVRCSIQSRGTINFGPRLKPIKQPEKQVVMVCWW